MNELEKKFRILIDEHLPQFEEQRFLLAVSGGVDSVVLSQLMHRLRFNFTIAHCNFQLRGEESNRDEQFVQQLAMELDVPFLVRHFDTLAYAEKEKISVQMAARDLRYEWFRELLKKQKFTFLVTAHHLNDQAETFFVQAFRSAGIEGLSGMKILERDVFRPLLPFSREEILHFAQEHRITWCEDSSNAETHYLRNQIRHDLFPLIEKSQPHVVRAISNSMQHLSDVNQWYRHHMDLRKSELLRKNEFGWVFSIDEILQDPVPRLLMFELLRPFGFHHSSVAQILDRHLRDSGKKFFSHTHRLVLNRGLGLLTTLAPEDLEVHEIAEGETLLEYPLRIQLEYIQGKPEPVPDKNSIYVDADLLQFPLSLRRWHKGDSFIPFGMKGRKKLSDFFIDQKMSIPEKEQVWVLTSADKIVWLVGIRADDRFKLSEKTTRSVKLSIDS